MRTLIIDDTRDLGACVICRTSKEGILALERMGPWDLLFLDYNLGRDGNGLDVMYWLQSHPTFRPARLQIVSTHPSGAELLCRMAARLYDRRNPENDYYEGPKV